MAYKDLRDWIARLEKEGELKRIQTQVNWNREIGALTRKVLDMGGPALLFENIKDYQDKDTRCTKLFTGGLGTKDRMALMLGMSKDSSLKDLIWTARKKFKEQIKPLKVTTGPVKENILKGEEINLYDFPVPFWHPHDGGRYFNTACGVVTKDPATEWTNVGVYCGMIVDKKVISVPLIKGQHWGLHYEEYRKLGKPMPVAIFYGWDPVHLLIGSAGVPPYVCEYDVMGSVREEPVELVQCETSDLVVPASSEIVVEGFIDFETRANWGSWADHTGYYTKKETIVPVVQIECITHRNDPIYPSLMECWGPAHPNEDSNMIQVSIPAVILNILESAGVPGVLDVCMLPASCNTNCVVQINKRYEGHAKQVASAIWGSSLPNWQGKNVIVVEEDIDIYDFESIEWAIAYRVNPGENDVVVMPAMHGNPLDPSIRLALRDYPRLGTGVSNRLLIDATKNWTYGPQEQFGGDIYPDVGFTIDSQDEELVKKRWKEYGFTE